jgi:hypothetical protein
VQVEDRFYEIGTHTHTISITISEGENLHAIATLYMDDTCTEHHHGMDRTSS